MLRESKIAESRRKKTVFEKVLIMRIIEKVGFSLSKVTMK
jgi:hypothetical protein